MKIVTFIISIVSLVSCSTRKMEEKRIMAMESWKGRNVSELSEHRYFKTLERRKVPHDDGVENWIFKHQTKFQSDAYCQSLGGCMGMPQYNCEFAFSVKNNIIQGMDQTGGCPGTSTIEPEKK